MDKCDSHDDCFKRLYGKVEAIDEKLDRLMEGIRNRMHDGDLRFERLEMRLSLCEKTLEERSEGHSDVKQKLVSSGIDLLKLAVIGIGGAAVWAFANGYLK